MDIINSVENIELVTQQVDQPCMAPHALLDEVLTFYKCLIGVYSIHVVPLDFISKIKRFPLIAVVGGGGGQVISVISTANLIFHILTIYTICAIQ